MSFISLRRNGKFLELNLDSELGTNTSIYKLFFECETDEGAELLLRHMNGKLIRYKEKIARDPLVYLSNTEKSALKIRLKDWNAKEHHWK